MLTTGRGGLFSVEDAAPTAGSAHPALSTEQTALIIAWALLPGAVTHRVRRRPWEGMATHSRILAQRIPWTEEPGRLRSMGWQRVAYDWSTHKGRRVHCNAYNNILLCSRINYKKLWNALCKILYRSTLLKVNAEMTQHKEIFPVSKPGWPFLIYYKGKDQPAGPVTYSCWGFSAFLHAPQSSLPHRDPSASALRSCTSGPGSPNRPFPQSAGTPPRWLVPRRGRWGWSCKGRWQNVLD